MPYMYQAAFYCDDCGSKIQAEKPNYPPPWDTDDYPAHYPDAGESDSPQHCDTCGCPLDHTLTDYGVRYVLDQIRDSIEEAIRDGRKATWDRIMPKPGTAEETHTYWHGSRHVEIVRGWAEMIRDYNLENYNLEKDEEALVDLFLELSR